MVGKISALVRKIEKHLLNVSYILTSSPKQGRAPYGPERGRESDRKRDRQKGRESQPKTVHVVKIQMIL